MAQRPRRPQRLSWQFCPRHLRRHAQQQDVRRFGRPAAAGHYPPGQSQPHDLEHNVGIRSRSEPRRHDHQFRRQHGPAIQPNWPVRHARQRRQQSQHTDSGLRFQRSNTVRAIRQLPRRPAREFALSGHRHVLGVGKLCDQWVVAGVLCQHSGQAVRRHRRGYRLRRGALLALWPELRQRVQRSQCLPSRPHGSRLPPRYGNRRAGCRRFHERCQRNLYSHAAQYPIPPRWKCRTPTRATARR